jgi:hypothetical protein
LRRRAKSLFYIGDEAVLTWDLRRADAPDCCVRFFEIFAEEIERNHGETERKFGACPGFKAGPTLVRSSRTKVAR